ncbi:HAD family hydrolase [Pseudomonas sp. TTU2014-080ASC]|uniref:HAD family hydrolase n=1 Tax=Pseudomonas sp. TTU2014-080ASC TaxID=1729724 RepID=UPI00071892A3|nr:HAD family hydrolase [Pseudomonas sp. TTU2014-080ASC]KRW60920.1 hypothetical protein AO726_06140 [Pseudomonas sp. TTU2014-080ASC]
MSLHLQKSNQAVAFFDFDGTLTTGDTLMPFLKFLVGAPAYYTKLLGLSPTLTAYLARLVPNDIAKQILLKKYLEGYDIKELYIQGELFCETAIPNILRHEGMERLKWHKEQGHECILLSASLDIYLEAFVKKLSLDGLICSKLRTNTKNRVSGELDGENCFGHAKALKLKQWLSSRAPCTTYGYGDSTGDHPFLMLVDEGWILKRGKFVRLDKI